MRLVWGTAREVQLPAEGVQRLRVETPDGTLPAVSYPALAGELAEAQRVLVNTTAVDLALGTGGLLFVVARDGEGAVVDQPSAGHIMKLRYTPLQLDVLAVESPESPHHDVMANARSLSSMPVVCCGLHSQVPLVAAAVKDVQPDLRIAYCMTDHAALPAGLSAVLAASRDAGLIDAAITCGQAFGGDLESVNLHSGLLAARHVARADVAIVAIGPGVVGTSTPYGHGGVALGEAINAVAALDGQPIAALRMSFADQRDRHRAVSHHAIAALTRVALASALVPVPELPAEQARLVDHALEEAGVWERHRKVLVPGSVPDMRGIEVTTMGRGIDDDPAFYAAAFAAGEAAAAFVQRD